MDKLIPLYHKYGENPCGKVAFYSTHYLHDGEDVYGAIIVKLDGTHPIDCVDNIICGSCGCDVGIGEDVVYDLGLA
jgi:hypothetical protein